MSRFITLTSHLGLEAASGTSYAFGVYSDQIKNITGFSQDQVQTVASVGNVGLYFAIVAGVVFDLYGPRRTLIIGGILSVSGYLAMWAALQGYTLPNDHVSMSAYAFIWSNGSSWFDTVAIASNIRNFPHDRGRVTGLLKSFYGLCASILTVIYISFFKSENASEALDILLFLAILSGCLCIVGIFTTTLVPKSQATAIAGTDATLMSIGMGFLVILAVYILIVSVLTEDGFINPKEGWPTYVMLPILALQAVLLVPAFRKNSKTGEAKPLLAEDAQKFSPAVEDDGMSLKDIVLDVNFWLLTIVMLFGCGAGLSMINNIAQHVKALRGIDSTGDASLYIVMLSVGNCAGRLMWGYASDRFKTINRPGWLTIVLASTGCATLACAFSDENALYFGVLWSGVSYGGFWAIAPGILADLFGTKWFAAVYSLISLFPALGSFLLSAQLAGRLYDNGVEPGQTDCFGSKCFQTAYFVIGLLCVASVPVGLLLTKRVARAQMLSLYSA